MDHTEEVIKPLSTRERAVAICKSVYHDRDEPFGARVVIEGHIFRAEQYARQQAERERDEARQEAEALRAEMERAVGVIFHHGAGLMVAFTEGYSLTDHGRARKAELTALLEDRKDEKRTS
jgi:hypothetical protein